MGNADNEMRDMKEETRGRGEVEIQWDTGSDGGADNGLMRLGSARCFAQNAAPTDIAQLPYDNNSGAAADASTVLKQDEVNLAVARVVGEGRCWIDLDGADNTVGTVDDYTLYVYHGTDESTDDGAWRAVKVLGPVNGQSNLLYNGHFTATDGDGDLAATGTPVGWTDQGTPATYTYDNLSLANGIGSVEVIMLAGAANDGLTVKVTGLKAATQYLLTARARPNASTLDSCSLRTVGADTTGDLAEVSSTIATGTSYTTLNGFFTTDATPTDIDIFIEADASGDTCSFADVGLFEVSDSAAPRAGVFVVSTTDTTNEVCDTSYTTGTCVGFISLDVNVPGPGYIVMLFASITVESDETSGSGNTNACLIRIFDGTTQLAEVINEFDDDGASNVKTSSIFAVAVGQTTTNNVVTYQVDVKDLGATQGCEIEGTNVAHTLTAVVMPAGN
jgi:hypothetical protein